MDSKIVSPSKRMLDASDLSPQEGSQRAMALTDEDLALVTGADGGRGFHHRLHHHHRRRHCRHRSLWYRY
jgi:hypothetical protein